MGTNLPMGWTQRVAKLPRRRLLVLACLACHKPGCRACQPSGKPRHALGRLRARAPAWSQAHVCELQRSR
eukprot:8435894-Alexandrium_andersonii.AAC.1